jgi:hypothetical protein
VKDLKKDEIPDSLKDFDQSKVPKQNICDIMYAGMDDESI